jgi:methionyl-tRNA formyltransferase
MSKVLNIIFAGTPDFAAAALQACLDSEHRVVAVFTQPDRPAGRGRKIKFGPVKQLAVNSNIPVYQPPRLEQEQFSLIESLQADLMLVSAYGLLLPKEVLSAPRLGCINIHASLLPSWRGAAPIQRAIIAGDLESGLSIMQMEEGLDSGPVLQQFKCDITANDTGSILHDRLANMAASEIVGVLNNIEAGGLTERLQDETSVSYAKKITKEETNIDWYQTAVEIERKIRAFNAWPVAYTFFGKQRIRIWQAELIDETIDASPGSILVNKLNKKNNLDVVTGQGVLRIVTLQLAGGKAINAQDFLNAHDVSGGCFSSVASNLTDHNPTKVSA